MAIPETIKIGAHVVDVKAEEEMDERLGFFNMEKNLIQLQKGITPERAEATLLHEIVEWISSGYELGLEHNQVTALSEILYQVLKENNLFGS